MSTPWVIRPNYSDLVPRCTFRHPSKATECNTLKKIPRLRRTETLTATCSAGQRSSLVAGFSRFVGIARLEAAAGGWSPEQVPLVQVELPPPGKQRLPDIRLKV